MEFRQNLKSRQVIPFIALKDLGHAVNPAKVLVEAAGSSRHHSARTARPEMHPAHSLTKIMGNPGAGPVIHLMAGGLRL